MARAGQYVVVPGPLRSFLRMAGLGPDLRPEEVLPELAQIVFTDGNLRGRETEFLILLQHYVAQARQIQGLADAQGNLRLDRCEDAGALLQLLGYHQLGACGQKDLSLVTGDAERAFLTIDSGFPLTRLEEAMQNGTPFVYNYEATPVPALLNRSDWTNISAKRGMSGDVLDVILSDPQVARLYSAFSKMDPDTRTALQRSPGLPNLLPYASVLDFYGSEICIRSRRLMVPGGTAAEAKWESLVGASPRSPGDFVMRLVSQDRGWMAAYYDTLARVAQPQQLHLTEGQRIHRLYDAFKEDGFDKNAAAAAFRRGSALLILFTRQEWQANGDPTIPGDLDVWRQIIGRHGRHVNNPEQVLEAMVSYSRADTNSGPLQMYLTFSSLADKRANAESISSQTLLLMAASYPQYSAWYPIFSEFPQLTDASIKQFVETAQSLDRISDIKLRGDAMGILQANVGLWQILARQGEIPSGQMAASWQKVIDPLARVSSSAQLFDAGESSLAQLMLTATGKTSPSQEEMIALLAGPEQQSAEGKKVRSTLAHRMSAVMEDQRLTSLDSLAELGEGMRGVAHGAKASQELIDIAGGLREFEMPRPIFTKNEKMEWAPEMNTQQHTEMQVRTDLVRVIERPGSPQKLEAARGLLAPFLRDTLVGLNYAYYEPPGSQILHINPLFVRSHDFSGETVTGVRELWQPAKLFGRGSPAGGGAYLIGSLADLPYVLAATEQNFIAPEHVAALIWQEVAPSLLAGSTLSRWWSVTPREVHAVSLYQQAGEEILAASGTDRKVEERVSAIFADRFSPQQMERLEAANRARDMAELISLLPPADTFFLAAEYRQHFPQDFASVGQASEALDQLSKQYSDELNLERLSRDFGVPHPTLKQNYGRELLNVRVFPAFAGYSNRLFGESWDSGNLYWARFVDEQHDSPEMLNILAPQLTRSMIMKITASDLEDVPTLVRAMHAAGDEYKQGKIALLNGTESKAQ